MFSWHILISKLPGRPSTIPDPLTFSRIARCTWRNDSQNNGTAIRNEGIPQESGRAQVRPRARRSRRREAETGAGVSVAPAGGGGGAEDKAAAVSGDAY